MKTSTGLVPGSVPALLRHRKDDSGVALRVKRLGLWQEISWRQYASDAEAFAAGLVAGGIEPGERVALISENRPEWLIADLGVQSAGAVTVGVYTTSSASQLAYCLQHSGANALILEDAEQLEKWLQIRDGFPGIRLVIVIEDEEAPGVTHWDDHLTAGRSLLASQPYAVEQRLAGIDPESTALFIYTSGTTGNPKGAMLSHNNLLWAVESLNQAISVRREDEFISFLPLSHIVERLISVVAPLRYGYPVSFTENLDTVLQNMQEIRPTVFFAVPRIWEKMFSQVELNMKDANRIKQWAYRAALRSVHGKAARGPAAAAAHLLVLRFLRIRLGLDRVRVAISGAAPISPAMLSYFRALGIDLREGYGLTESTGLIAIHRQDGRLGTVGQAFPGVDIRIADDGEILSRSPGNFIGYHDDAAATRETLQDGWLHTGDIGEVDGEGNLSITDRKKDIIITAGGKNIAPQKIENQLKASVFINDAVVIGDRRPYLVALIVLDEDNITKWAIDRQIPYTTYGDLCRNDQVRELIGTEVEAVNRTLARVETVKKFAILSKRLYHEDGEVTATLKVKRSSLAAAYGDLIESLY